MADGAQGDVHADDTKLHGKPDKTLRFSLCSDNLEGISEGQFSPSLMTHKANQAAAMLFFSPFKGIWSTVKKLEKLKVFLSFTFL